MDNLGPADVAAQTIVNIQYQDAKKESIGLASFSSGKTE